MDYFATSLQHVFAELERVDLLIRVQVWHARQVQQAGDEFQGLYISEQEVDALLAQPLGMPRWLSTPLPLSMAEVRETLDRTTDDIAQRKSSSHQQGITLRLDVLARRFHLTPEDVDVLLICLAPEVDLRYERLYAYLQDDVTKRRPSVELVLNLMCSSLEAKLAARRRFMPSSPLMTYHLLHIFEEPSQPHSPLLSQYLKVDDRIANYLLDTDDADAALTPYTSFIEATGSRLRLEALVLPEEMKQRFSQLAEAQAANRQGLILYCQGANGVGKQSTAEAFCHVLDIGLYIVDGERLLQDERAAFTKAVRLVLRETLLRDAALYWHGFDALLADDAQGCRDTLLRELGACQILAFLAGATTWEPVDMQDAAPFVRIEFPVTSYADRVQLWTQSLRDDAPQGLDDTLNLDIESQIKILASKFRFNGGQIQDTVVTAGNLAHWREPQHGRLTIADLYAACRLQSNRNLSTLARKITPHYTWDDIVLPADCMSQLREICNQVKHRGLVFDQWGFDRKLSMGKGLNALFSGQSGTGKTMAADIIAGELGLDLYKIDLASVVSKFIGETEKNLARIFDEAETSNAILFFDEADALFGKRSEVRDAHDRYANIEISYLLQRMEAYEGIVILTTNLRKNMDDAFVRRLHFTIEFPMPAQQDRQRIWENIWPPEAPCGPGLDLDFMARRFEIAGGHIRNIALSAAFLAAGDGRVVEMSHLMSATQREYQKMGKVLMGNEFGEYAKQTMTSS